MLGLRNNWMLTHQYFQPLLHGLDAASAENFLKKAKARKVLK